jgi:hypothetical protein
MVEGMVIGFKDLDSRRQMVLLGLGSYWLAVLRLLLVAFVSLAKWQ